jgi:uncharacterized protein
MGVPGLGPKTYEQAAGFLRINGADNPLEASAVHPESYAVVENMARDHNCTVRDLMKDSELRGQVRLENYVTETTGLPTLSDIMEELAKPGRDPREPFEVFAFTEGVNEISDLEVGMKLPGVVTNVTDFGAFVDIGVHQDGLVHISELADGFVKNPHDVAKVSQKVSVTVIRVDMDRGRIALSMRTNPLSSSKKRLEGSKRKRTTEKGVRAAKGRQKPVGTENPFVAALKDWKPSEG